MDANELGRWTRFAAKGGVGRCTAVQDCVAEEAEDLMFLKDDEIVVLMQLAGHDDLFLGYCEGVVGRFHGADVRFHGRLKKPVMTKRSSRSLSRSSSRPSSAHGGNGSAGGAASPMPRQELSVPSTPSQSVGQLGQGRMSQSFSAASISVTEDRSYSASSFSSPPLHPNASPSPHPYLNPSTSSSPSLLPTSANDEAAVGAGMHLHLRSASHSSGSTALESAPRTPADFGGGSGSGSGSLGVTSSGSGSGGASSE